MALMLSIVLVAKILHKGYLLVFVLSGIFVVFERLLWTLKKSMHLSEFLIPIRFKQFLILIPSTSGSVFEIPYR